MTPFNFTSIASNLCMTPVLMGNVALWKPSTTSTLSNYYLMKLYKEAGLPDGVINFLPGSGALIGKVATSSKWFSGIHFTGSTGTFNSLWRQAGENLGKYVSYPRLVGETGGKDFIFVHPSADAKAVATAAFCGAYEFQGQKCSAASRMYVPKSLWPEVLGIMKQYASEVKMGDVRDHSNYINAVIDEASWNNIDSYISYAEQSPDAKIVMGGGRDKSVGYFVEPTIIETTDPHFKSMEEEIFGPVLTVFPYDDDKVDEAVKLCDTTPAPCSARTASPWRRSPTPSAMRPATSTSTTSPPVPWSATSRSAAPVLPVPTTRPAASSTSSAGSSPE